MPEEMGIKYIIQLCNEVLIPAVIASFYPMEGSTNYNDPEV